MFKFLKIKTFIKNLKLKVVLILSLFFILCLPAGKAGSMFLVNKVYAQSLSLGIYPPLLETIIKPNKTITQAYKIINNGESDLVLTSKILSFQPADEFGNVTIRDTENEKRDTQEEDSSSHISRLTSHAIDWFSFQNADLKLGDSFILKAGSEQQVVLKIKIPEDALENDYYLTLLFESQPENYLNQSASQTKIKIGANILLTVSENGEPLKKAQIEEFSINNFMFKIGNYQFIDSFANPEFVLRIKNIGKTFFKPNGTITVSGWTKQKYLLDLLPENIINQSIRQLRCFSTENNSLIPCRLTTNWKTKFLIGFYQAQVNFGLDKTSNDYQQTLQFIALPFRLLGGILILTLITTLIIALTRHCKRL